MYRNYRIAIHVYLIDIIVVTPDLGLEPLFCGKLKFGTFYILKPVSVENLNPNIWPIIKSPFSQTIAKNHPNSNKVVRVCAQSGK